MENIKLIAIDLDGTLLDDDKQVSLRNIQALESVLSQGVTVAIASARDNASISQVVPICQPGLYYISSGGALIYDPKDKRMVWADYFSHELVEESIEFLKQYNYPIFINNENDYWVDRITDRVQYIEKRYTLKTKKFSKVEDTNTKIMRVSLAAPVEVLRTAAADAGNLFRHRLTISLASHDWLDLLLPNAGKGALLALLQSQLNITSEQTMAIGDYESDLSLFEQASHRVAMANAVDLVKNAATYLTASNTQDGVAQAIEKYFSTTPAKGNSLWTKNVSL